MMFGERGNPDHDQSIRIIHSALDAGTPRKGWTTRAELRSAIFEYIEGLYNPGRLRSALGMRSPLERGHGAGFAAFAVGLVGSPRSPDACSSR